MTGVDDRAVRILFTFTGGSGHFLPTLPIARALAARGAQVIFSPQEAMVPVVEAAGFAAVPSGGRTLVDPTARLPLQPVDRAHEKRVLRDHFAGRTARERAARLLPIVQEFRPQVIVRDEVDFAAAVVAEHLGLPHVAVVVLAAGGLATPALLAEPLSVLRAEYRLPPDPAAAMLHRHLTLVPVPVSYRDPGDPLPATARHIRPAALEGTGSQPGGGEPASESGTLGWLARQRERPTVYFTLGTVFHQESGDLFRRVLAGLGTFDANIVVTVGREINPLELGDQPSNVRVERYVPQEVLLPRCDVVVSHAGSGSVMGALAFGVPLVLLPLGADQPQNADRCGALGVARILDPLTATPSDVCDAAFDVMRDPCYRRAAVAVQREISALPTSADAAEWIEDLVLRRARSAEK